jgi:hypothetical protein
MSRQSWVEYLEQGKLTYGLDRKRRRWSSSTHYYVYYKPLYGCRVQLGWLWKKEWKEKGEQWQATLLTPDHKELDHLNMAQQKAHEMEFQTELGAFASRGEGGEALKLASEDRGLLSVEKAEFLGPLELLAEAAE